MAELVRGNMSDPGVSSLLTEDLGNAVGGDRTVPFDEQPIRADVGGTVLGDPVVEQFLDMRVQWDVAVVVELADWDPKPVGGTDLHYRIDCQAEQLTTTDAGAGQ